MRGTPPPLPLLVLLLLLVVAWCCVRAGCPPACDCLWRSGKETVLCVGANLTAIPRSLDAGTQVLDLTGNAMHIFQEDAFYEAGLANLQKVFAARCAIVELHRNAFRRLSNLVELDLSDNALLAVPSQAFACVPELRELRLAGNGFVRVEARAFASLQHLVRLDLSRCGLRELAVDALAGLERSLEWLRLDNNSLASARLPALGALHGLALASNPWECGCKLRPLFELRRAAPTDAPYCAAPQRLAGRTWDRLPAHELACAPRARAPRAKAAAVEGDDATLECEVEGDPVPLVRWLWRDNEIGNASTRFRVSVSARRTRLTVLAAGPHSAGEYVCAADNAAGQARASVTLTVRPAGSGTGATPWLGALALPAVFAAALAAVLVRRRRQRRRRADKMEMNHAALLSVPPNAAASAAGPAAGASGDARRPRFGEYRGVPVGDEEEGLQPPRLDDTPDAGPRPDPAAPLVAAAAASAAGPAAAPAADLLRVEAYATEEQEPLPPGPDLHIPRRRDAPIVPSDKFPDLLEISPYTLETRGRGGFGTLPRRREADNPGMSMGPLRPTRRSGAPAGVAATGPSLGLAAPPYSASAGTAFPAATGAAALGPSLGLYEQQATQLLRFLAEYRSLRAELLRVQAGLRAEPLRPQTQNQVRQPAPDSSSQPYWLPRRFGDPDFSLS